MIKENIGKISEIISDKCIQVGREVSEVKLIAVSKNNTSNNVLEAYDAGLIHFGENKAQELRNKSSVITERVHWHFIGHLQTNKVKMIIDIADYIHSVDSVKLAEEINKRASEKDKIQKIFLEINTSNEESKYGIKNKEDIFEIAERCKEFKNLELLGLMTMAPYTDDTEIIRKCFKDLYILKSELNNSGFSLTELSMGMSNDFEIAIEEGATFLRIGTSIFGERIYNNE